MKNHFFLSIVFSIGIAIINMARGSMDVITTHDSCRSKKLDNKMSELVDAWQSFLERTNWHLLIEGVAPITTGCGIVYELPNFLNRANECFAIVDMGQINYAEPHYHPAHNSEIYFVLQGTACVVVGMQEHHVQAGDIVVIPPLMAHFTIPDKNYVIAVVNTPPFDPANYIPLHDSNEAVMFDKTQLRTLTGIL